MISEDYKNQLQSLHSNNSFPEHHLWYDDLKSFLLTEPLPSSIIDFGCSHGSLIKKIKNDFIEIQTVDGYDPGVPAFENKPERTYDVLVSTDVIEHIEPLFLDDTLKYIDSLYEKTAWVIIACYPAKKILSDGRNAHLTIESPDWWLSKIEEIMEYSVIDKHEIIVHNPDSDYKKNGLTILKGKKIDLRLILRKK